LTAFSSGSGDKALGEDNPDGTFVFRMVKATFATIRDSKSENGKESVNTTFLKN
jgi:hypothetical protein